ncbi:MAG: hypothetical protein LBT00_10470 [Spirochaetaceae bacterium]|jgi:hypothetical protein|nr:hypothetical protein [Spirochaetaceae bacterium]
MNGIPTTFNDGLPAYTVVGGERCGRSGVSVVLLSCRELTDRESLYHSLKQAGFDWILSIETRIGARIETKTDEKSETEYETKSFVPDIGQLSAAYPFVRFVLLSEPLSAGSQINLAATELREDCFLVLRKDCVLDPSDNGAAADRAVTETLAGEARDLCAVPLMFDKRRTALPIQPLFESSKGARSLRTRLAVPAAGAWHLFPFEGIGVYNRELFVRLGGYDNSIEDEYWQLMDFGLRAYTWGERIRSTDAVKIVRTAGLAQDDIVIGESYRRFYLKNLSPVYRADAAYLPLRRFPFFLLKSGVPFLDAWHEFSIARVWVSLNAYRWKCDVRALLQNWDKEKSKGKNAP